MLDRMLFVSFVCLSLCLTVTVGQDNPGEYYVKRGPVGPVHPVYIGQKLPDSVQSVQSASLDFTEDSRKAKAVDNDVSKELVEMSKLADTLLRYFDFTSGQHSWLGNTLQDLVSSREARSELGDFLQWKGDILQPLALLGLAVLSLYTASQILAVLAPPASTVLGRTFSSLTATLATALQALYDQLILIKDFKLDAILSLGDFFFPAADGEDSVEARRRRRAVDDLSNVVFSAVRKYQNKQ